MGRSNSGYAPVDHKSPLARLTSIRCLERDDRFGVVVTIIPNHPIVSSYRRADYYIEDVLCTYCTVWTDDGLKLHCKYCNTVLLPRWHDGIDFHDSFFQNLSSEREEVIIP